MNERPKCETTHYKTPKGKQAETLSDINHKIAFWI